MQDSSLEKQMQQLMSGLEFEPDAAVWENVEREINPKKKKRVAAWWWLTGLLLLCLSGGILWHSFNSPSATQVAGAAGKPADGAAIVGGGHAGAGEGAVNGSAVNRNKGTITGEGGEAAAKADGAATVNARRVNTGAGVTARDAGTATADKGITTINTAAVTKNTNTGPVIANSRILVRSGKQNRAAGGNTQQQTLAAGVIPQAAANNTVASGNNHSTDNATDTYAGSVAASGKQADSVIQMAPWQFSATGAVIAMYDKTNRPDAPAVGEPSFTPAVGKPEISVPVKKKQEWEVYPVVAVGAAANIGGENVSYSYGSSILQSQYAYIVQPDKSAASDNLNTANPGSGVGGTGTFYLYKTQRFTYARPAFRAGLELHKALTPKWRLLTGLQYQFVSYKSVISTWQNGVFASTSANGVSYDYSYRLHYLAVPLQMQYCFPGRLGITAGIINNIALSGSQREESIRKSMRFWVPSGMLAMDVLLKAGSNGNLFRISPFVQYGLKSSIKGALDDKRMLQGGIQAVWQINNK
jgi:hypothetical protein